MSRREQLRGFIRAQTRIRVSDVATQLRLLEAEAEALLTTLIARHEVGLVYRDAPVIAEAVLPGDKVVCAYCAAPFLVT